MTTSPKLTRRRLEQMATDMLRTDGKEKLRECGIVLDLDEEERASLEELKSQVRATEERQCSAEDVDGNDWRVDP